MNDQSKTPIHTEEAISRLEPPPPRRRWHWLRRLFWLVFAVVPVAALVWFWPRQEVRPERAGRFGAGLAQPVGVATVEKGDIDVSLNALGTVTPMATVAVKTQIAGRLLRVLFQEGQMVKQGDLLAEIDSRPYQFALEQAQGQLNRDQALLRNAEQDLARYRTLVRQDSIAKQQLDTTEALVRQYQGAVRTDQALVDNARLNLEYCRIVAPISGRVGIRAVDAGNYVQANDANSIAVINQLQPITVMFSLPEDNVAAIMKRVRAGATLPVTVYDRGQTNMLAKGVLATIDNQIDTSTGTVKLKARFDNTDEALFPNQFVNTRLLVDTLSGTTVVPTAAILRGAPGTYVFAVNPDSTVSVKVIKTGPVDGNRIAVASGLEPGMRVVVDGTDRLRDGAKVQLPSAESRPAAGEGRRGGGERKGRPGGAEGKQGGAAPEGQGQPKANP